MTTLESENAKNDETRSLREVILARATRAKELQEPQRRLAVKGLMHERFRAHPLVSGPLERVAEAEIFQRAYEDPSGELYWRAWLYSNEPESLPDLLAAHTATNEESYARTKAALKEALNTKLELDVAVGLHWLIGNPNTARYVPKSLREHLQKPGHSAPSDVPEHKQTVSKSLNTRPKKRGPKPIKFERVCNEMRRIIRDGGKLPQREKGLASLFGVSRDTCRRASKQIDSEISAGLLRQIPTNDK